MKIKLIDFCKVLGIEKVGIAPPGPYKDYEKIWQDRIQKNHITGLEEKNIALRTDARETLESAQSVIVCLFPYFIGDQENTNISISSYSLDYHSICKAKLERIGKFLKEQILNFEYKAFVDNGPLSERHIAYLAGLGYIGLNSNFISDQYGSYVFIGYIINNYAFELDHPVKQSCMRCGQCIRSCPGGAISGDCSINPRLCRSFITQKKGELTKEEIEILQKDDLIYGCDICQEVCPHNANIPLTPIEELKQNIKCNIELSELEDISNKEFIRQHSDRAFSWRGKGILLRNYLHINKNKL